MHDLENQPIALENAQFVDFIDTTEVGYVFVCVSLCVYVCMCVYVCVCVSMHVHIHVCLYMHTRVIYMSYATVYTQSLIIQHMKRLLT